ncbi:cystatin-F [Pholidichthys leucotaenia]
MMEAKVLLMFLLALLDISLVVDRCHGHRGHVLPGSPRNISTNDLGLQQAVLAATYFFNNQSNDAFLFKPSSIQRAQKQIVKGIRYITDVKISRTVCRKRDEDTDLSKCDFQPAGGLQQTFQCHVEIWTIPWQYLTKIQKLFCKS